MNEKLDREYKKRFEQWKANLSGPLPEFEVNDERFNKAFPSIEALERRVEELDAANRISKVLTLDKSGRFPIKWDIGKLLNYIDKALRGEDSLPEGISAEELRILQGQILQGTKETEAPLVLSAQLIYLSQYFLHRKQKAEKQLQEDRSQIAKLNPKGEEVADDKGGDI